MLWCTDSEQEQLGVPVIDPGAFGMRLLHILVVLSMGQNRHTFLVRDLTGRLTDCTSGVTIRRGVAPRALLRRWYGWDMKRPISLKNNLTVAVEQTRQHLIIA